MARSYNNAYKKTAWTADRKAKRAIEGKQTRNTRKNERRDIERSLRGDDR